MSKFEFATFAKAGAVAAALALGALAAAPASAASIVADDITLKVPVGYDFSDSQAFVSYGTGANDSLAAVGFFVSGLQNGTPLSGFAFCLDPFKTLPEGSLSPAITWTDGGVNFGANDTAIKQQISNLVVLGESLADTEVAKLAAVQGAIWQLTTGQPFYGLYDASGMPPAYEPVVTGWIGQLAGGYDFDNNLLVNTTRTVRFMSTSSVVNDDNMNPVPVQSIAFLAPVPEPGTWALMIVGFFGTGALIRRGRRLAYARA